MKMTNFTYGLECYLHMFSPERQEEINRVINHWVPVELKDGRILSKMVINPETGVLAHCKEDKTFESHSVDYNQKFVLEKFLTPEELALCDNKAVEMSRKAQEKRRYDAARKITENEWNAPVFDDGNYYNSIDELFEHYQFEWDYNDDNWVDEGWREYLPNYVYGSIECQSIRYKDLDIALDNIMENNLSGLDDEYDYYAIDKIPDYLQEAWKRFVDENGQPFYEIDYKTVILLK
jgi:hypothetical protein